MLSFDLAEPTSLAEAVTLLDPDDPTVRPVGGATALMLMMKAGVFKPSKLISLRKIEEKYAQITPSGETVRVGALTTLADLERSAHIRGALPLLSRTLLTLSNIRVRNMATVGGALAHGDPHMDLPPVLMALGATANIVGADGMRSVAVEDLFTGYYETVLATNELIADVEIPVQGTKKGAYLKVTTGSADDWPALGVAVVIEARQDVLESVRLVVSAATDKATRIQEAEDILIGTKAEDSALESAADIAVRNCEFIADVRGSIAYKRELTRIYVKRAIHQALGTGDLAP
jgi:carbon-monoxide dehydrogenase medium subunit